MDLLSVLGKTNLKQIYLKGGQTNGFIEVKKDDSVTQLEPKHLQGTAYVEEYLQREKMEADRLYLEESLNQTLSDLSNVEITSQGVLSNVDDILKDEPTKIYSEYFKDKPKSKNKLIINDYKAKILSMIESNEAIIITGQTGCGKTTQVPQFILDSYVEKKMYCNIVVTQPRRIAAMSIPKRVCEERDWPLGTICGYKVGLKDRTSEDTRLTYCTNGVFLQMLIAQKHMNDYTHVILDEVHERDQPLDFILLLVKKLLNTNSRNVKVILMSATADVSKFAKYFEKRIQGVSQPAPVINVATVTNFLVQIHYLEELSLLGELPDLNFDEPIFSDMAVGTCIKLIKQFEQLDDDKENKKSVLIFVPGIYEIEELYNKFKDPKIYRAGSQVEYKWFPIPLHSSITSEEQALAFRPPPFGYRKIILATNIAESSITVPDVMFVIDFCLTKVLTTDVASNFTSLQMYWASKANCTQRAGRVGRVMEGRVYRLVSKNMYKIFADHCIPDMLRCPLEKVVLQSKLLDMGSPKAVLALAIDPPDLSNLERTLLILKEAGGLLLTLGGVPCVHDGDLTYLGRLMAIMPVDIHVTRLIVLGHMFSCLEECIIMGAALTLKSVFSSPFQARMKSYNAKLEWADGSCSDCIAFLNVYEVWRMNHSTGYFKRSAGDGEIGWAKRHFIQLRSLREVHILVEELTRRLQMQNIEKSMGVGSVQWSDIQKAFVLKFVIAGAFYPNYFGRGARGGQVNEKMAVRTLGGRDPFTTVYLLNYPSNQPRELYSHLIKQKLVECKEDMKISYDSSSKVFIEFRKQDFKAEKTELPFNGEVPGKISTAVYRAVRMRQILKNLEINVLPPNKARETADALGLDRIPEHLARQSIETSKTKEKLFQNTVPSIDVSLMPIKITYIASPGHFWATSAEPISVLHEAEILKLLNDPNAELESYTAPPPVGEMCVAPFRDEGEILRYRVRVDGYPRPSMSIAQVFYIDYGNTALVPVRKLLRYGASLHQRVGVYPMQCFECVLTKVKPSMLRSPSGKWCEEAREVFEATISDADLIASIYSVVGSVVSLVLYKVENQGKRSRQVNVNQMLVERGFAEEAEESYLSQVNNDIRMEGQLDSEQRRVYNHLQMGEDNPEVPFHPPDLQGSKFTIKLGGPFSPLEMKVYSCAQGGLFKQVNVSFTSVNAVLLDSDPQDPHERLIVAAHISQNQAGSSLNLHNTTIMPNIRGLAALMCFVFAPTIELRVNEKRSRYTGILCGLGVDDRKQPMFPEHDMEIVFDCEFTFDDFSLVNKLRFFMSMMLLSDGKELTHSTPDVISFQNNLKDTLVRLIDKHRPSQELEFPQKEYKWNLVDSNVVVSSATAMSYNKLSVFPLHPGVSIYPIPNEKKNLRVHVDNLHAIAHANLELATKIDCELCSVPLASVKDVRLHLRTDGHQLREEKLRNSLFE